MLTPFPDEIPVEYGLVNRRMIANLPPLVFFALVIVALVPLYIWGKSKWWLTLLAVGLGRIIAEPAVEDPDFGLAWQGEMRLPDYLE